MSVLPTSDGAVLVVQPDRRSQRTLQRVLATTQRAVHVAGAEDVAGRPAPVVVVDLALAVARPGLAAAAPERCVAVPADGSPGATPEQVAGLLAAGWRHVVASPPPCAHEELALVAQKFVRGDVFGLDKHLSWAAEVHELSLRDAAERVGVIDELVRGVAGIGLSDRLARQFGVVAEELLANAICAAPVDVAGERPYLAGPRDAPRRLAGRDAVSLRWGFDGRVLAVEVRDVWGSLDPAVPGPRIARYAQGARTAVGPAPGMGLALAHAGCHQLSLAVAPGERTEALAVVDVRRRPTELGAAASFHVFVASPNQGARP